MIYENKRNGKRVIIVEKDVKCKTVMLQEIGSTNKPYTTCISTFKRWYKQVEDDVEEQQSIVPSEKEISERIETVEVVPVKKKEKANRKSEPAKDFTEVENYIQEVARSCGMSFYTKDKLPFSRFYVFEEGHILFFTRKSKKKVELHCKTKFLPEEVCADMIPVNHNFNRKCIITDLSPSSKKIVESIIKNIKVKEN